jgi:hypothetical protein
MRLCGNVISSSGKNTPGARHAGAPLLRLFTGRNEWTHAEVKGNPAAVAPVLCPAITGAADSFQS